MSKGRCQHIPVTGQDGSPLEEAECPAWFCVCGGGVMGAEGESEGPDVLGSEATLRTSPLQGRRGRARQACLIRACLMGAAHPSQRTGTLESGPSPRFPEGQQCQGQGRGEVSRVPVWDEECRPRKCGSQPILALSVLRRRLCRAGIVRRFKNKGVLAWALLAEGRRGWPCPRPKGHLAGKRGLTQLHHQHGWERGGSPENRQPLGFCHERGRPTGLWVPGAPSSLPPLKAARPPHQKLPTTSGHWGDTRLPHSTLFPPPADHTNSDRCVPTAPGGEGIATMLLFLVPLSK